MKKIIVTFIGLAGLFASAQAQETRKQTERPEERQHKEYMARELNLTDAQKEELKSNRELMRSQLADLEKNDQLTVKEYRLKKAAIQKDQKEKMDKLLTEEQKKSLATKKIGKHGKDGKHRSLNAEQMRSSLGLSDEQVARLKINEEKNKAAFQSIREDKGLTPDQKKEKMKEVKIQSKAFYKETLTPEQLEKMKSLKKERGNRLRK